jgi:hypothetical protein
MQYQPQGPPLPFTQPRISPNHTPHMHPCKIVYMHIHGSPNPKRPKLVSHASPPVTPQESKV